MILLKSKSYKKNLSEQFPVRQTLTNKNNQQTTLFYAFFLFQTKMTNKTDNSDAAIQKQMAGVKLY